MKVTIGNYASYIYVKEWDESFKPLKTKDLANGIYLDYNKDGELVGIEILDNLEVEYYSDYEKRDK
jgi:uncharacterized protein YuzE